MRGKRSNSLGGSNPMCIEDIRISRRSPGGMGVFELGVVSVGVAADSATRTALIFCPPDAGTVRLVPGNVAVAGQGVVLAATDRPYELFLETHRALVTKAWSAFPAGGATRLV